MSLTDVKRKELEVLRSGLEKKHGKGIVQVLEGNEVADLPRVSSGSVSVDEALGGGYPWGRIVEIYGPESSGKTTITLEAIAQVQKLGKVAAFIDAEHAMDLNYAKALGVKVDELVFAQPDSAEQALELAADLANSGVVDCIVVDSVAALTPKAELDGEMTDNQVGLQARLLGKFLRKVAGNARKNNVLILMVNQIRMKVGVMFGNPEVTPGGNALKYYASIRMEVRKIGTKKDGDESVADETRVIIKKNKTAPPYRVAEFQIQFGKGINKTLDLLRVAVSKGIVDKSGAWYSLDGERLGQGELNTTIFLDENPEIREKIYARIKPAPRKEDTDGISTRDNDL